MYLGEDNPGLMSFIKPQVLTLGEFVQVAHSFARDLIALDPALEGLGLLINGKRSGYPIVQPNAANLRDLLYEWAWDHQPAFPYVPVDDAGRPVDASTGPMGFQMTLTNNLGWDEKVDIAFGPMGSGADFGNVANFTFGRVANPQFRTDVRLARALIATLVKYWPVEIACYGFAGIHQVVNKVADNTKGRKNLELNWLTYTDDPSVAEALPPDINVQRLGPGILFQLTPEILSPYQPEHVALAERVRESLRAAGKLKRRVHPSIPLPISASTAHVQS